MVLFQLLLSVTGVESWKILTFYSTPDNYISTLRAAVSMIAISIMISGPHTASVVFPIFTTQLYINMIDFIIMHHFPYIDKREVLQQEYSNAPSSALPVGSKTLHSP